MKVAEKIKNVLRHNPEVVHNRARLRAMYYLVKKHPGQYRTSQGVSNGIFYVSLLKRDTEDSNYLIETVACAPLTEYLDNGCKKL